MEPVPIEAETETAAQAVHEALQDAVSEPIEVAAPDTTQVSEGVSAAVEEGAGVGAEITGADASSVAAAVSDAVLEGAAEPATIATPDASAIADAVGDAISAAADIPIVLSDVDASAVGDALGEQLAPLNDDIDQALPGIRDLKGGLTDTAGAASVLDFAVAGATGSIESASGAVTKFAPAGAVLASVAAAAGLYFTAGERSEAATARLNLVFGDMAEEVQKIDLGGLTGDLGDLAREGGSSGSALKQATADFGQFALAFGTAPEEVAATVEQLQALSLRAAALNPTLGDAGQVMEQLFRAMISGRPQALAPFALGISKIEIEARAMEIALADGRTEITALDKVMAAASLSTEKLGGKLGTDFAAGIQQASIQFRALTKEIGGAVAAAGLPLVEPVLAAAQALTPVAVALSEVFGVLLQSIVPIAAEVADAFSPALVDAATSLQELIEALEPAIEGLGEGLAGAATVAGLALSVAANVVGAIASIVEQLPEPVFAAAAAFVTFRLVMSAVEAAAGRLTLAMSVSLTGLGAVVAVVGAAAAVFSVLGSEEDEAAEKSTALAKTLLDLADAAETTEQSIVDVGEEFTKFLTNAATEANPEGLEALRSLGLDAKTLGTLLRSSEGDVDAFFDALDAGLPTGDLARLQIEALRKSVDLEREALQAEAQVRLLLLNTTDEITDAQLAFLESTNLLEDGSTDYVAALGAVKKATEAATLAGQRAEVAAARARLGNQDAAASWRELGAAVLAGADTFDIALRLTEDFDFAQEQVDAFAASVENAIETFASSAAAALPTASDAFAAYQESVTDSIGVLEQAQETGADSVRKAFEDLLAAQESGEGVEEAFRNLETAAEESGVGVEAAFRGVADAADPKRLVENLFIQQLAIQTFGTTLEGLAERGLTKTEQFFALQGPELGGAYAKALLEGEPAVAQAFEDLLASGEDQLGVMIEHFRTTLGPEAADVIQAAAEDIGYRFDQNLDLETPAERAVAGILKAVGINSPGIGSAVDAAGVGGDAIGQALVDGLELALLTGAAEIATAAGTAVQAAIDAAKASAGIDSPSKAFRELGAFMVEGLALGFDDGAGDVVAAAEQIVRDAAGAVSGGSLGQLDARLTANVNSGSGANVFQFIGDILVSGVTDEDQARGIGVALMDGVETEIERRRIVATIRSG